jgi:predicted nucleic acid-binding protein
VIVADSGAIVALLDRNDRHHDALRALYDDRPDAWVLPWAILPEVDYIVGNELGPRAQDAFLADVAEGAFNVEFGRPGDLDRAHAIARKYRALRLGLVDAVVMATAERLKSEAIATVDLRHFGAVTIAGSPRLLPRDGQTAARSRKNKI